MATRDDAPAETPRFDEVAEPHLQGLGERFLAAMDAMQAGRVDEAAEELRAILKVEPRLAEPRLELGRLLLEAGQLDEAAEQAQEAISILESGGQWIDDLDENVVLSVAWNLRGEALRRTADQDEVVFGDPAEWTRLVEEARAAFAKAAELDPENAHAAYWAGGTDSERLEEGDEDADAGLTGDLALDFAVDLGEE